jgi:hypothetical protein
MYNPSCSRADFPAGVKVDLDLGQHTHWHTLGQSLCFLFSLSSFPHSFRGTVRGKVPSYVDSTETSHCILQAMVFHGCVGKVPQNKWLRQQKWVGPWFRSTGLLLEGLREVVHVSPTAS